MNYTILPFRFERFNAEEYLLTNDVGEYIFLGNEDFDKFVNYELDPQSDVFKDIASKQIATTDKVEEVVSQKLRNFINFFIHPISRAKINEPWAKLRHR